jgi:hypothetical protein
MGLRALLLIPLGAAALTAADAYKDLVLNRWWTRWNGSANADGLVTVRAFYGKHRVTVNGKETIVELK